MRRSQSSCHWTRLHTLIAATAGVFLLLLTGYVWTLFTVSPTRFTDPGLEAAVRGALAGANQAFTPSELRRITELDAARRGITSLDGIEQLSNLAVLDLQGNRIEDVSPLTSLTRLHTLNLGNNNVTDLRSVNFEVLSTLPELRSLNLANNRGPSHPENPDDQRYIRDISLLSSFVHLESLELAENDVTDITALADLTRLRHLDLRDNPLELEDLAVLSGLTQLEHLNLRDTGLRSLRGIQELRNLSYLNLHSNSGIDSIVPIAGLPHLHTLILRGVPVGREAEVLISLESLVRLNVRDADIRDLSPLARLMAAGAVQDDPDQGVFAQLDIRENPVHRSGEADGYQVLTPFWETISVRSPQVLPQPLETGPR